MMSSAYPTPDPYKNAAFAIGMEMDMEVKSEPDCDYELYDSAASVTSSVEEVPVTANSSHLQSDDELEDFEDEPLVEIDSVTVPQELVEVELQPSLLLFVDRKPTAYSCTKNVQTSEESPKNNLDLTKEQALCKVAEEEIVSRKAIAEEEIANRKAITKALRNIKRKIKSTARESAELYVKDNSSDVPEAISQQNHENEENHLKNNPSSYFSSSQTNLDRISELPTSRKCKKKATSKYVKPRKKQICTKSKIKKDREIKNEKVKEEKQWISSLNVTHNVSLELFIPSTNNEEAIYVVKDRDEKENTQNNSEVSKKKKNLLSKDKNESVFLQRGKIPNKIKKDKKCSIKQDKQLAQVVRPESYDCTVCGKKFREKSHLATHSRAHIDIRNYECNECGHLFKTKTNLFFHMKTHEEAPFICDKCNKIYPERKMLMRHIRVVHSGEGSFSCDQCGRSFKSAHSLDLHYTLHVGNKPFSCSVCSKSFVYKSTYVAHMKAHEADDTFSCELCPSNVANKGELRRRCNHHSEARPWLCTVCGKGYPFKGTLKNHMKTHEPEKPFKCEECRKSFMKKQSYECHMKIHAGENPQFMCDQCSQSYFNVFALKRHYMKHTSERRFICDICNKAFWMKDALKVHKRSHASVKLFQCTQCSKAFAHKHTLVAHLRTHSNDQPYSCTICPKTFIHKYNLDRHERQHIEPPMAPPQPSLSLPPPLLMMPPPNHIDLPTLHIL